MPRTKNVLWAQKPPTGYVMRQGLYVPDIIASVFNENADGTVVRNYALGSNPATKIQGTYSGTVPVLASGRNGVRAGVVNVSTQLAYTGSGVALPTTTVTIICGFKKRDAVLRASGAFGAGGSNRLGSHCPYSDGIVYWDFGTNRISKSGLTFGDDIWAFTMGPRNQELWQNGVLVQTGAAGTRVNDGFDFSLGQHNTTQADLVDWDFFYMWSSQLPQAAIQQITERPFRFFDGGYKTTVWAGFAPSPLNITIPVGALAITTYAPAETIATPVPVGSLTTTTYAPAVATNSTVPTGSLTLTAYAPALTIATPIPVGSWAFTTYAPALTFASSIEIPVGSLTLTTFAPSLSIAVPSGSLTITGYAPTLVTQINIEVPAGVIVLTGYAPIAQEIGSIPVPAASLTLTTYIPVASLYNIAVPARVLTITTYIPGVGGITVIEVPTGHLTLTGYAPSVFQGNLGPCAERFGPKIYFWEPSYLDRPEDTFLRATDWDAAGYQGLKFVQGLVIEADTEGQTREILLQGDQTDIETLTINHDGQQEKAYSLNQPVLKHLLRLLPTDSAFWRLFNVRWVYEPAPEYAFEWKTQGTDHDLPGFQFLKDGYIAHASTADITLNITVDDTTFTYTIPHSSGEFVKTYMIFGIHPSGRTTKGTLFTYELTSSEPFQLYQKDCEVRVHDWSGGEYLVKQPFGDISRIYGARI